MDVTQGFNPVLVTFTNNSVGYNLTCSWNFDANGVSEDCNPAPRLFDMPGDYHISLAVFNGVIYAYDAQLLEIQSEEPWISSVEDIPGDLGGWVDIEFYHSVHDATPAGGSEQYSVQRSDLGDWVTVATVQATGAHYYAVTVPTQGDGSENWLTDFRVIAHMDEGEWTGPVAAGFSLDNTPDPPANLHWLGPTELGWDWVDWPDWDYFRVYGSLTNDFAAAVHVGSTELTNMIVDTATYHWFFVTAVSHYDLESEPAVLSIETSVPGPPLALTLRDAYPNPFNPSTTLRFALPEDGPVRLCIYDLEGRLVDVLVDDALPAGQHAAVWAGTDRKGRALPTGGYFGRLVAGKSVRTVRMTLVK